MSPPPETPEARRKRLLWRATHRGIKEMDILFGGYVEQHIASCDEDALRQIEIIIDIPDQQMLAWATHQETLPADAPPLLRDILRYRA